MVFNVILSVIGAIIGLQVLTTLGITPNTAIIGVILAIVISRIPVSFLSSFRSVHRQNLLQSNISSATFGAANSLILPIGIPYLLGRQDLVLPMLLGATMGMLIDLAMLYWFFDSRIFPAKNAWPPGLAAAEAIIAGDRGGKRARLLIYGTVVGIIGSYFKISMSAFGVAFIGNIVALAMFGVGLLIRGYAPALFNIDINKLYIPHGMMIGAGLVALIQIIVILTKRKEKEAGGTNAPLTYTRSDNFMRRYLVAGCGLYLVAAIILSLITGLWTEMSFEKILLWVVFAAFACVAAEFIVGLAAMHAGWFPAFATALIFLVLGMLMGFPPVAAAILVGFVASGGPAFADAGYDLRAGWWLRGQGKHREFEMEGRWQQIIAGFVGLMVGLVMVFFFRDLYFSQNLFAPVDRVYVATIKAGVDPTMIKSLLIWAIPGAIIQALGGATRQMGILLATGLLIMNPLAGWAVLAGIAIRYTIRKKYGEEMETPMTIFGAGCIAGDALYGFFTAVFKAKWR
jgi:uncharacterized oligopeptide transporter (OPT) family protein